MTIHARPALASLVLLLTTAPMARGQGFPAIPGAGAAAAPTTAASAATTATSAMPATPASGGNIWSKICLTPEQKAACKKHWCESGIGQMVGTLLKPMTFATGGMIKGCCPGPNDAKPEDLAKPADSADGAAARVKEDEAQAKERRANVRYLGTVDCSRYPEVEKALINALRTDRNECVRLEAALVLGQGCCCTRKTVEALMLTATGSDKDGNPKESSNRVRATAEASMYSCQNIADLTPEPPEKLPGEKKDEKDDMKDEARIRPRIRPVPVAQSLTRPVPVTQSLIQPVQMLTSRPPTPPAATAAAAIPARVPTGQRGLLDLMRRSVNGAEPPR